MLPACDGLHCCQARGASSAMPRPVGRSSLPAMHFRCIQPCDADCERTFARGIVGSVAVMHTFCMITMPLCCHYVLFTCVLHAHLSTCNKAFGVHCSHNMAALCCAGVCMWPRRTSHAYAGIAAAVLLDQTLLPAGVWGLSAATCPG